MTPLSPEEITQMAMDAVNAAARYQATYYNKRSYAEYVQAMKDWLANRRQIIDANLLRTADSQIPIPPRPEVPHAWLAIEDPDHPGYLTLALSPVELAGEAIPDPPPPAPPQAGVFRLGPEIPAPADVPGERWFMALAGDTVTVGTRIQRDGRTYERRERRNPFGAAPYYVLVG